MNSGHIFHFSNGWRIISPNRPNILEKPPELD